MLAAGLMLGLGLPALGEAPLKDTMDGVVKRLYARLGEEALASLDHESALGLFTEQERHILATKYWQFDVNVPVVVSVMRNVDQPVVPFWLAETGFGKTGLVVKNEEWAYEVWQKSFGVGRVELGINGFGMHRSVYFVCVGPQDSGARLEIDNLFPAGEAVVEMTKGAWTYRDWDDLYIEEVPERLEGQRLLTTFRGRAREAHLVGAFRKTPFPSSEKPGHVALTWSADPRHTQTIQWRTNTTVKDGVVRYRAKGADANRRVEASAVYELIEDRLLMNDRYTHRHTAVLRGLKQSTAYAYTVGSREGAWSAEAEFTTAPEGDAPFSFVYFGDTHYSAHWGRLLQAADVRHPDTAFYTIGGDVVSTGLFRNEWDHVLEYGAGIFDRKPLAFSLGNHDDQDGLGAWMPLALFAFPENGPEGVEPERTYSFRYGNTLFLMLDVGTSPEVQAQWMEEQLAATDATWRIGIYHFPMYCFPEDDEYGVTRARWGEVFAKYPLDLMLHGHVHQYIRTQPMKEGQPVETPAEGTIYLVSLGTKGHHRPRDVPDHFAKYLSGGPWYVKFDIDGNRLTLRAHGQDGTVHDELVIEK